jgi:hypothetical protein
MNPEPGANMIDIKFLDEQIRAKPFIPFTLVLIGGERYQIRTKEHIVLPPLDEVAKRPTWFVAFNAQSIPRYFMLESIAGLTHD